MKDFYKNAVLLATVTALIICVILLDFYLFHDDPLVFWITFPILVAISGLAIGKLLQIRKTECYYFDLLDNAVSAANRVALLSVPMPVAIIDNDNRIVWCNSYFKEHFFTPDEEKNQLKLITAHSPKEFLDNGKLINYSDRSYRVFARLHSLNDAEKEIINAKSSVTFNDVENITIMFFTDITDLRKLQEEQRLSKPVVMTIMPDLSEDIQKSGRDSEKAKIISDLESVMEAYFPSKNAVLRKLAADRYIVIMEERHLREMKEEKMAILDQVRDIGVEIYKRSVVSLSIGIGRGKSLYECEELSRDALDFAIGRGGDQAIIKSGDNDFEQVGAASQNTQNYSKIQTRYRAEAIKQLIRRSDAVYVMGHQHSDFDSAGAAIGLTCAIRRLDKKAYAVINKEQSQAKPLLKLFQNEYTDDPVIITPKEAKERFDRDNSLLIIVDTHVSKLIDDIELYEMADSSRIVVIDHHRRSTGEIISNPAVMWQEANASSASELVTDLIRYFNINPILKPNEANALLAGITLDTKDFVMRASTSTFEAAARLRDMGADTIAVKKLFSNSLENNAIKQKIVSSAEVYKMCAIAVADELHEDIRTICSQAADEMLYLKDIDAAFTIYPTTIENAWGFCARSFGKINVQLIMESLGNKKDDGGGHQGMAGALLKNITPEDAKQKLYEHIDQYLESLNT